VYVDPALAAGLPAPDRLGGIAEAVKICYAGSPEEFREFVACVPPRADMGTATLERAAWLSLRTKKRIIEADEFDTGERQLLNFGHTFGHALEAATGMALPHGLGVAVGMRAAITYAAAGAHADVETLDRYAAALAAQAGAAGWAPPTVDWTGFTAAFESDKKHTAEHYRLVLPAADGRLRVVAEPRTQTTLERVVAAAQQAWDRLWAW
jgi:3-dehydroquinate synthase